jgi:hypothetical protein
MVCKLNTRSEYSNQMTWYVREQDIYARSDVACGASENRPTRLFFLTDIDPEVYSFLPS